MRHTCRLIPFVLLAAVTPLHAADALLVDNGQARAEIVISEDPTRMQRVAAHEFLDDPEAERRHREIAAQRMTDL